MSRLAIAIPHYNHFDYLERCLRTAMADAPPDTEFVVVDNASQDDSARRIRTEFPDVRLIANSENLGFAKAANQAIRASTAPYVLLLNNDTEVLPGAIAAFLEFAQSHDDAGAVGCMLLRSDGKPHRLPASIFSRLAWDLRRITRVPWLVGAALLLRRQALEAIGGFDEAFFFYYEDVDLGLRLRKAGWSNYYLPSARIVHHEKISTGTARPMALVQLYRGRLLLARRHYPWASGLVRFWQRLSFQLWAQTKVPREDLGMRTVVAEIRALLKDKTAL